MKTKIIVITGAESTGKSELTHKLASHFRVPFIAEYARTYVEKLGRKYTFSDVEIIAREQVRQLNELKKPGHPVLFSDTWLIITKIWFEEAFGKTPGWLESEIRNTWIDLFLVCGTDLPWIADPVRENGGNRRNYLQKRYLEEIRNYGFDFSIVTGENEMRFQHALKLVMDIL